MVDLIPEEIQLILKKNYLSVYKGLIQKIGLVPACVLSYHIEKFENLIDKHQHSDEWYYLKTEEQCSSLGISSHMLRKAKEQLLELGLLFEERRGTPSKLWYKIDFCLVVKCLNVKSLNVLMTSGQMFSPLNNNKNNNNKNKKTIGDVPAEQSPVVEKQDQFNSNQNTNPIQSQSNKQVQIKSKAIRVLNKLNSLSNKERGYKPTQTNLKNIMARLNEGFSYRDCIQVLETKIQDPYFIKNPKHFNPETLFRPSKFEKYLNESPDDYKQRPDSPANGTGFVEGRIDYGKNKVVIFGRKQNEVK